MSDVYLPTSEVIYMLTADIHSNRMWLEESGLVLSDAPYAYTLRGQVEEGEVVTETLSQLQVIDEGQGGTISRLFSSLNVALRHRLITTPDGIEETIAIQNLNSVPVNLEEIRFGFCAELAGRETWRLRAIPFLVQLDGSRHDYSAQDLASGNFHNAVYHDPMRVEPELVEQGILRSEAWAWGTEAEGVVIIKYNNQAIELSVAAPFEQDGHWLLRFGGAGLSLYGEPSGARLLQPGEEFIFGTTFYRAYQGGLEQAYQIYRDFIERRGHGFPPDYDPPVNWNELYDVGWYHSDREMLRQNYTRQALLKEAEKAAALGCDLLYLDPGWEVVEGTTQWDEERLGPVVDLIATLKEDYGLDLAYRTILRCHTEHWPERYMVKHPDRPVEEVTFYDGVRGWELCLCNPEFWQEKLERILEISRHGVRFMMFDEMDWRGPCYDETHGHSLPSTPIEHVRAVYALANEVRRRCPGLTAEVHDPVWPWSTSLYVPTYFQQGFGELGSYDENWGFEYMWDCLNDLRSGKALALYYYALGCNVPLYLHITMAADNDRCVFFWWTASTVRHLGIGGKTSHPTIEPGGGLPAYDRERRFAAYQAQMRIYRRLKPYFSRGRFHGLAENAHLHTLSGKPGGVLLLFNLKNEDQTMRASIPLSVLQSETPLPVQGAEAAYEKGQLQLRASLPPMSPALVCIGAAVDDLQGL